MLAFTSEAFAGALSSERLGRQSAQRTTEAVRELLLARIDVIQQTAGCRRDFERENIDFARLRLVTRKSRFYSVVAPEGKLRFSAVVQRPASPDQTLQTLAQAVTADAFVLGYQEGSRYVRTAHVVLGHGYFEQSGRHGERRPTTLAEKQTLLLHELLHIALDSDDHALDRRDLCTLRLITFCPGPLVRSRPGSD